MQRAKRGVPVRHAGNRRDVCDRGAAAAMRVRGLVEERVRFLRSFLTSPRRVGAILPTSAPAVRAMLDMAPIGSAGCIVELGAGTGPLTREILRRMSPHARLLAFEVDTALAGTLRADLSDPRLSVIADSAERLGAHLGGRRPDVIVSALPFTSLPVRLRRDILAGIGSVLRDDGVLLVLQYSPFLQRDLQRRFDSVERRLSPLNLPPAVLFACRRPLRAPGCGREPNGEPTTGAP